MQNGINEGNGKIIIHTDFLCSTGCAACENENKCNTCKYGYYHYANDTCMDTCPSGYVVVNSNCRQCSTGCSKCTNSPSHCNACKSGYYYYSYSCYTGCNDPKILNLYPNKHLGKDNVNMTCKKYKDVNCLQCYSNYATCQKCDVNYHLVNGNCVHDQSNIFTLSNHFSSSLVFSDSKLFSESVKFSKSELFSNSHIFSNSQIFSNSVKFTSSKIFTDSKTFSSSEIFSDSDIFTQTPTQSAKNHIKTCSLIMSQTLLVVKTVTFTGSYSVSMSQFECTNSDGKLTFCLTRDVSVYMFPYIIKSISPSLTFVYYEQEVKYKQVLSNEMLIGIVCGSVSALFAIIGIIILIKNRNKLNGFSDIWEYSSENEDKETVQTEVHINDHLEEKIDHDDEWI